MEHVKKPLAAQGSDKKAPAPAAKPASKPAPSQQPAPKKK